VNPYRITPWLLLLLFVPVLAAAQVDYSKYPYLLRLEHRTHESDVCVLLQKSGAFHLEMETEDSTRVFEGSVNPDGLREIDSDLHDSRLEQLSQSQIDEPLIRGFDLLLINIFRRNHWQDLIFYSLESQDPYRQSLRPLTRWLDSLHKLPHRELSEEEGKNNCLTPHKIVLKKRTEAGSVEPAYVKLQPISPPPHGMLAGGAPTPTAKEPPAPILRVLLFGMKSNTAYQKCILVTVNGSFRAEERTQKSGSKSVSTQLAGGSLNSNDLLRLHELLGDPALLRIRHHEGSRATLPVYGEMVELQIFQVSGVHEIVLSSTFGDPKIPFFYSGDGDIKHAQAVMTFLDQQVDAVKSKSSDPTLRNDCQSAP
jgi:hypothetical protein